mmetsp:Transcript_62902/g.185787  ORF Transcript_62902/g.185787 Transcript_62902/m.185787 type:complete len:200 (+) Transcript_62902:180-779(+)
MPSLPVAAFARAAPIPPPLRSPPPILTCWFIVACSCSSQAKFLCRASFALLSRRSFSERRSPSTNAASRRSSLETALRSRLSSRRARSRSAWDCVLFRSFDMLYRLGSSMRGARLFTALWAAVAPDLRRRGVLAPPSAYPAAAATAVVARDAAAQIPEGSLDPLLFGFKQSNAAEISSKASVSAPPSLPAYRVAQVSTS